MEGEPLRRGRRWKCHWARLASAASAAALWAALRPQDVLNWVSQISVTSRPAGSYAVRLVQGISQRPRQIRVQRQAFGANPWEVLGVSPGASQAEIKRAYRRKALKEHPDVSKAPNAKERWQELSAAYDVLSDPEKLRGWERARNGRSSSASSSSSRRTSYSSSRARADPSQWKRTAAMEEEYDAGGDSFMSIFSDLVEAVSQEVAGTPGGTLGKVSRVGAMLLEDLLEYLEKGLGGSVRSGSSSPAYDGSAPQEELQEAQLELRTLEEREVVLKAEVEAWEKKAQLCQAAGDRVGELDGMQKCFDARERLSKIRRRVLSLTERVAYLQKVVFEFEKRKSERTAPSTPPSTSRSAASKPPPALFDADAALADLKRKRGS